MSQLSKSDDHLLRILDLLKLEVHKVGTIKKENIASITIKAMRHVEGIKGQTGETKKTTVGNLVLMLLKSFDNDIDMCAGEIDDLIQDLFDCGVLVKKSCCCFPSKIK